ncbi:GDSL-type esterase/lipase family protein [Nocardiopsis dassonvillei]|uniref:GDSL-type esterase/lipase family protein n=1 Tax=Nocardiopsis dassonvillei TaxID=2014 RepID=UPI000B9D82CA|nr:GDSL-type esterase/lipase family protein [Nocardiopsis dassonvillei]ASU60360.1 lipase [Nocardiopsis dassonvillei]
MAVAAAAVLVAGCSGNGGGDGEGGSSGGEGGGADSGGRYLSLGDSISVGVQPDGNGRPVETSEGYTDVLYRTLKEERPELRHERMGCAGEDTTTFMEGGLPGCDPRYEHGSQLEEAEAFLAGHRGEVDLVTLTIGANNFTRCVRGINTPEGQAPDSGDVDIDRACVEEGLDRLREETPEIAERLREAAGPDTQIVGMTYYNPFLAFLLLDGDPAQQATAAAEEAEELFPETEARGGLAEEAVDILLEVNGTIAAAYRAEGIDVAEVDAVFESTNQEVPRGSGTGLPANLQNICDLTWMCHGERGPDIHPNEEGAREIAAVFARQVDRAG